MSFQWKMFILCGIVLVQHEARADAETLEAELWRTAYDSSLRCDARATRNALVRLHEFHRFKFIQLSSAEKERVGRSLQSLSAPAAVVMPAEAPPEATDHAPIKKARKRKPKPFLIDKEAEVSTINTEMIEKTLLKKAKAAYEFGRLEEAKRCFSQLLKLNPHSDEAKQGVEKVEAEMR